MTKGTLRVIVGGVLCALLVTGVVLAMSSTNYRLDWYVPLTGGGGGPVTSANYAANFTVGQSLVGPGQSDSYAVCLGYWCSAPAQYRIYLPLGLRNS